MNASFPYVLVTDRTIYPEPLIPYLKNASLTFHHSRRPLILREKIYQKRRTRTYLRKRLISAKPGSFRSLRIIIRIWPLMMQLLEFICPYAVGLHGQRCILKKQDTLLEKGKTKLPYPHGVGISIHFLSEVETALQSGASYLIVSPLFPTSCKPNNLPLGLTPLPNFIHSSPCLSMSWEAFPGPIQGHPFWRLLASVEP